MTRTFLAATVAVLAIAAPAQAQRGDDDRPQRAQRAEKAEARGGEQRVQRQRAHAEAQQQRVRSEPPQRAQRVAIERPQRAERMRVERRQPEQRVRPQQMQRRSAALEERRRVRDSRLEERRLRAPEAQRAQVREQRAQRRIEQQQISPQRLARQRTVERRNEARAAERQLRFDTGRAERQAAQQVRGQQRDTERLARLQERLERREARVSQRAQRVLRQRVEQERQFVRTFADVGKRFERRDRDWSDRIVAQRFRSFANASDDYLYDYNSDNGYLYQVDRDRQLVTALFPVLGGAFGVGQPLPIGYQDYNVPYGYRSLYYDTPDYYYRYGDGAIYRVDPTTQLIQGVVALLTGQRLGVGQMLPAGYDVYNVPFAYRDDYYDSDDAWYRYDDGYIYQVDPYTRRIVRLIPVSYGSSYAVGYPMPTYASYGGYGAYGYPSYGVPYGYQSLYYDAPGYNYHYANGGIYQVDPLSRLVTALVALVTGTNLGVGQMLPAGYDVYNVPFAYRDRYFDTQDAWYRYDDGYIYQVDPHTRLIETAIPVSYGGYTVGYPAPAGFGYDVPDAYDDLYYAEDGYDYRYFDGGIYQLHPDTQVVLGVPALLTGHDLAVGHPLPVGYDVYNVPYAYRDRYYDSADNWYRYADGHIYQVDPTTRLITAVIDAIV